MINDFEIRAAPMKNELIVTLDGYFMKSEVELAFQIAKLEMCKLRRGFRIIMNIKKFETSSYQQDLNIEKLIKILRLSGGGSVKISGNNYSFNDAYAKSGGLYPNENEWNF